MGLLPHLYSHLKTPAVRDLACALLSAPLHPKLPVTLRHPLSASIWQQEPEQLQHWLLALDNAPEALLNTLAQASTRLGRYYEALWLFTLRNAPDIRVIAHNRVIYEDKRSLGELDFLLEDQEGVHHLELAVKFYLAPDPAEPNFDRYLGPASHDTLGAKLKRLTDHQLKVCEHPQTKAWLNSLSIKAVNAGAWLTGTVFYATSKPLWLHQHIWQGEGLWVEIPRERWLSPFLTHEPQAMTLNPHRAQMLARLTENNGIYAEQERQLLVPNHWPNKAPRAL